MNTKYLMIFSAIILGALGLISQFLPTEIIEYFSIENHLSTKLFIQLLGAVYIGFAMVNWMAKDNIIGGIYSRPVSMGNLTHFAIGAITLIKLVLTVQSDITIIVLAILYTILTAGFAYAVFTHPVKSK